VEYGSYSVVDGVAAQVIDTIAESTYEEDGGAPDQHPVVVVGESIRGFPMPPIDIKVKVTTEGYVIEDMIVKVKLVTGSVCQRAFPLMNILLLEDITPD